MSRLNDEQRSALLSHAAIFMGGTSYSVDADTLVALVDLIFANPVLVARFPSEKLSLYKSLLKKVAFVASKLTRCKPELPSLDLPKSTRIKQKSFYHNGFGTLVRLCSSELISIIPEGKWTDMHAHHFCKHSSRLTQSFQDFSQRSSMI